MSRVSYQAMLEPSEDDGPHLRRLQPGDLPSRRKDAQERLRARVSPRHARWLDEVATQTGLSTDVVLMAALDLMIALDLDWSDVRRARDLREAVIASLRIRPPSERGDDHR